MKPKFPAGEKHIDQIAPPKAGLVREQNNQTSIAHAHAKGRMLLTCPICFTAFHRPASHVARMQNSYCSRACSNEAKKIRVEIPCVVCGKIMSLTPFNAKRIKACSRKCQSLRKRGDNSNYRSLYPYKDAVKEVHKRGVCCHCGTTEGPWAARGIEVDDEEYVADTSKAELWCLKCHMKNVNPFYWQDF